MRLESWADSNIGLVRKSNQDTVGCFADLRLFVVADGMGGRADGAVASRLAVEAIHDAFAGAAAPRPDQPAGAATDRPGFWRTLLGARSAGGDRAAAQGEDLREAVGLANQRVHSAAEEQPERTTLGTMGTTVVALVCDLEARRAHWAHVGDSRLYRARGGEVRLLTADHTLFGEAYWSAARVPPDLPHTNRLVRAVGIEPTVEVAVGHDELRVGDLFLLCSDGVSGMVEPDALRATLLGAARLADVGRGLIERALAAGGKDNASALLVRVAEG